MSDREQLAALLDAVRERAPAERRDPRRRRARRRRDRVPDGRAARAGDCAQGRRGAAPARADRASGARGVRAVLLGRGARSAAPARATTRPPTRSWTRWRAHRRARGLPALAGVGPVGEARGMAGGSARPSWRGWARSGIEALSDEQGPGAVRRGARGTDEPLRRPVRLDAAALRAQARMGCCRRCCAAWSVTRRARASDGRLAGSGASQDVPEAEREGIVLSWCAPRSAAVLGHASPQAVERGACVQGARLRLARRRWSCVTA